ncbi:pre-mRNA 3'-end-processing factor FIP1 [Anopheles bellator]|uniref:pre-mRNA 3'-end-processing factor FIP1 n=1 Tax=Anopheles bellator TaxID=139047 RepID=UPI0026481EAA|nr:pre-mRNA 3'-end-processing factor FIP1 [Anopheles bellator]
MADEGNEDSWLYGNSQQDGGAGDASAITGNGSSPGAATGGKNALWDVEQEGSESENATREAPAGELDDKRRGSNEQQISGETGNESGHEQHGCDDNAMDSSDLQQQRVEGDTESHEDSQMMEDSSMVGDREEEEKQDKPRRQTEASAGKEDRDGENDAQDGEAGSEEEGKKNKATAKDGAGDESSKDKGPLSDMESDIDSDEDDDINVVIGDIKSGPSYNIIKQRGPIMPNQGAANAAGVTDKTKQPAGKFSIEEFESVGAINGVPAHEFSIDSLDEKPWRKPGSDITDYFNYGFNEETWRSYCERQKRMRQHESGVGMAGLTINNPQAAQPSMSMRDMRRSGGPMGGGDGRMGPRKMNGPIEVIGGGPGGPMGGPMGGGGGRRDDGGMGMSNQPKENVIQVMTADRREYSRTVVGNKYDPSMGGPPGFGGGPPEFYHPEQDYSDYYDPMQESQWGNDNGNWQPTGIKTLTPGPPMMQPNMVGMPPQQHIEMMGGGPPERMVMPPPQQMQLGMVGGPGMGPGPGGRMHPGGMPPGRGDMRNPKRDPRGDPRDPRERDREREQRDRRDRERERDRDRKDRKEREHRPERDIGGLVPKEEPVEVPAPTTPGATSGAPSGAPATPSSGSSARDDKDKRSTKTDRHKDARHRERSRSRERSKSRRSDRSRERDQSRHSRDKKKSHRKDKEDGE